MGRKFGMPARHLEQIPEPGNHELVLNIEKLAVHIRIRVELGPVFLPVQADDFLTLPEIGVTEDKKAAVNEQPQRDQTAALAERVAVLCDRHSIPHQRWVGLVTE